MNEYADALNNRAHFPPVVVYHDGKDMWLSDGFHRYHAHRAAGRPSIFVDLRRGTVEEARFYASSANATHGKPRTAADKTHAILLLLTTEKGKKWLASKGKHGKGLQAIADHVGCSQDLVRKVLANRVPTSRSLGKGKTKPRLTKAESEVSDYLKAHPDAGNAEVAAALGVHRDTVTKTRAKTGQNKKPGTRTDALAPILRAIEKWTEQQLDLLFAELRARYPGRFA
ncbi:MAG: hypothetical protein KF795_00190 [Labilithrix sp.]|nr:hypothetical protein [Labilithrix sp.]